MQWHARKPWRELFDEWWWTATKKNYLRDDWYIWHALHKISRLINCKLTRCVLEVLDIASHSDVVFGSSRNPPQERVTNPWERMRARLQLHAHVTSVLISPHFIKHTLPCMVKGAHETHVPMIGFKKVPQSYRKSTIHKTGKTRRDVQCEVRAFWTDLHVYRGVGCDNIHVTLTERVHNSSHSPIN